MRILILAVLFSINVQADDSACTYSLHDSDTMEVLATGESVEELESIESDYPDRAVSIEILECGD